MPESAHSISEKKTPSHGAQDSGEAAIGWQTQLFKIIKHIANTLLITLAILLLLYCWGVIFYNGPLAQANWANALLGTAWTAAMVFVFLRIKEWKPRALWWSSGFFLVLLPYLMIKPTNDRSWEKEFARTGYSHSQGDVVTLYNIRNFRHHARGEFEERWETRRYHLSKLRGLDYFQSNFYGDTLAHTILSFDFGDDGRICLSVETRRETGEEFTPFGGLYKIFELQYIFITEDDCIPLRTQIRGETVRRYTIKGSKETFREMFLASVKTQNELAEKPSFYNVLRANCTTSLRTLQPKSHRPAWDHRLLLNGMLDEHLYEENILNTNDLSFDKLRQQAIITEKANAAMGTERFSEKIRAMPKDEL